MSVCVSACRRVRVRMCIGKRCPGNNVICMSRGKKNKPNIISMAFLYVRFDEIIYKI